MACLRSNSRENRSGCYPRPPGRVKATLSGGEDVVGEEPQLGPLQQNGGPSDTEAIAATSPAYNQIPVA